MTQRRHKPIATPRRKASGAPKKTVRSNEGCDYSTTWNRRHEDNRQWLEEQFSKRRSVSKATKSEYRFCPRSDAIGRAVVSTISSRKELYPRRACSVWTARGVSQLEIRAQPVSPAHSGTFAKQQPGTCITLFCDLPPLHEYVMKLDFLFL